MDAESVEKEGDQARAAAPRTPSSEGDGARRRALRRWAARVATGAPFAGGAGMLATITIRAVLAKVGHPGATLDDSYIHFQYARAIAGGHPFRFQAGEPITSGATSILWPALLAPFYAVGLRDNAILWAAWALSFAALALLSYEAYLLTARLAGKVAGGGAAAMVLAFTPFTWFAASGMEVVPFAWALARCVRRSSEWVEDESRGSIAVRTRWRRAELVALAWTATLLRPEGAPIALFVAAALVAFPLVQGRGWRRIALRAGPAALAAAGAAAPQLLLLVLTGSARSTTTVAKLMIGNPYFTGDTLWAAVKKNAQLLVGTLLNGEVWSAEFLPKGASAVAIAGLVALCIVGFRSGARWRAVGVLLLALTMFAPCFYVTFLWNRLRYLWPFATGWIIGLACLARLLGDALAAVRVRWRAVTPLACGVVVATLLNRLDWVVEDVAQSASGIDRQQVALGRWAREHLPDDARIGVNDTGAIAYFGDRRTFDIVGLTTKDEARYWIAGAGSRFEHYERLRAASPARGAALPTHFIVYPEWMGLEAVLGAPLHEATVLDSTILGGTTMRVYEADWSLLGTGEQPFSTPHAEIVDAVDVADLESEADHAYPLLGAVDGEQVAKAGTAPDGTAMADGGRTRRAEDRFVVKLRPGRAARLVARLDGAGATRAVVRVDGAVAGALRPTAGDWEELAVALPAGSRDSGQVTVTAEEGTFASFHYWVIAEP